MDVSQFRAISEQHITHDAPLTEDVEGLRLLALADGVADLALDDGAVLAPVEAVQTQLRPVVPRHDGVGQEPPEKWNNLITYYINN